MANTHEHLEHAEHGSHHAQDPFDKRVAVTIAIVAAILAGISMVGHRTHNLVLQHQGDANRLRTEAAAAEVEKSNLFAWYQSKRNRQAQLETAIGLAGLMPAAVPERPNTAADRGKQMQTWDKQAKSYNEPNKDHDSLPELRERGAVAGKKAAGLHDQAAKFRADAEHAHHMADRLDIAHLSAELGLILCSIALLTKRRAFWFTGIFAAVLAMGITASAYMIPHEPHDAHAKTEQAH